MSSIFERKNLHEKVDRNLSFQIPGSTHITEIPSEMLLFIFNKNSINCKFGIMKIGKIEIQKNKTAEIPMQKRAPGKRKENKRKKNEIPETEYPPEIRF